MPGFLESAANLATGGLYGEFSGMNDRVAQQQQQAFMDRMAEFKANPELAKQAGAYDPGVVRRIGNLLSGGLYGKFSGMDDKMRDAQLARGMDSRARMQAIMEDPAFQQQMRIQQGLPASITFDAPVAQNQPQPQYFAPGSQGFAGRA